MKGINFKMGRANKTLTILLTIVFIATLFIGIIVISNLFNTTEEAYADSATNYKVLFWYDENDVSNTDGEAVWKLAIVEELKYIHTLYPSVNITVVEKNNDFTLDESDLDGVNMIVMAFYGYNTSNTLSSDIDTQANADVLKAFADKGGRIMMFAEYADENNEGNAIFSGLAQKMGGGFEITDENYDGAVFSINPNYADTLGKDIVFFTDYDDYVNLHPYKVPKITTTGTADYVIRGIEGTDDYYEFVVNQTIGNGCITIVADGNILFNNGWWYSNTNADWKEWYSANGFSDGVDRAFNKMMVRFLYNNLLDSSISVETVHVEELINAIGTVEYTPESKEKIDKARAAYNALDDEYKQNVSNYEKLTKAEADYANLVPAPSPSNNGEKASHGFCIGWIVFIFMILELLTTAAYVIVRFHLLDDVVKKCKLDILFDKVDLMTLIGLCVTDIIFIFALIALCVHPCAVSIVGLVFATLTRFAFVYFFFNDKGIIDKFLKKQPKTEEKKEAEVVKD